MKTPYEIEEMKKVSMKKISSNDVSMNKSEDKRIRCNMRNLTYRKNSPEIHRFRTMILMENIN